MPFLLTRLALREIQLPLVEPFHTAHGAVEARRILLAELTADDGTTAWSECVAEAAPAYSAETVDSCWLALTEWLAAAALGVEVADGAAMDARLAAAVRGNNMARATIGMGCWALDAQRRGIPLATLLAQAAGGVARPRVASGIVLGFQPSTEALVERAGAALAAGYRRVKVKVEPGRDVAPVRALREAFGGAAPLSVDANCAYSLDDPAHRLALQQLDTLGLGMIEQPLDRDDLVRHAELQRTLVTPLCLDESIAAAGDVASMLALGSGRMVNLKPGRVGGFSESLAAHALGAGAGIPLWCGGMLESGIGRAYNVALASLPGFTEPGDLSPSARYWAQDVVSPAWTMDAEGQVRVPLERAGLGVEVDVGRIDGLTVRRVELR